LIKSEWQQSGGRFDWTIKVPPNTTATIYVPATDAGSVTEGGRPVSAKTSGVEFLKMDKNYAVFQIGSGNYRFVSQ
jgi:alpha-L-rhamnosidase